MGLQFTSWDRVVPQTTNEAMKRTDNNFSSWSDHKEWMDVAFARALKAGADAINSVDPDAYVSICGAQMPGWGGYDYYRLTNALSALEPYNIGSNVEIIRSINPRTVMLDHCLCARPVGKTPGLVRACCTEAAASLFGTTKRSTSAATT